MIFGARLSVAVLTILGLASDALVGVHAAPSRRAPALARVVRSCTKSNVAALTFVSFTLPNPWCELMCLVWTG